MPLKFKHLFTNNSSVPGKRISGRQRGILVRMLLSNDARSQLPMQRYCDILLKMHRWLLSQTHPIGRCEQYPSDLTTLGNHLDSFEEILRNSTKNSAYDRELQAIYIFEGRSLAIKTDHKPPTFAFNQKADKAIPRQLRQLDHIG